MPNKLSRILWTILAVIVAMVIVGFLLGWRLASSKIAVTETAWNETLGSREEIMERFPPRGVNDAALELERLTARIGIDIVPRTADDSTRPSKEAARRHSRIKKKLGNYLENQVEQPRRSPLPPPEQLIDFLEEQEENLAAIRRHLLEGDLPRWELRLDQLVVPFPNLIGHVDLQKLLIAEALVRNGRGEGAEAVAALEACWALNSAIRDDPYLLTQLIAISITRLQAGALRQIEDVPVEWRERLIEHDFRESFFAAILLESWHWTQIKGPQIFDERVGRMEALAWTLAKPYAKYCLADLSDDYRRRVLLLAEGGASCDYYLVEQQEILDLQVPFWNVMGALVQPNILGSLDRLARLELDLELTGRVLALESSPWDESVEQSSVCSRDRWVYGTEPDGSRSITFSREISWPDQKGAILPTSFYLGQATDPTPRY